MQCDIFRFCTSLFFFLDAYDYCCLYSFCPCRSIVEEERGVAHIVEHLAFSATKKYTNHDIVKFLESVGAEFSACQNATTSADETIYES